MTESSDHDVFESRIDRKKFLGMREEAKDQPIERVGAELRAMMPFLKKRKEAGVPEEIGFQTKPEIALEQIRQAMEQGAPVGVVLADAGYGKGTQFRTELTQLGLQYAVDIESNATVWEPGQQPLAAPARRPGRGAPPKRLQRNAEHQPISVKQLALGLPASAWKEIGWRQGSEGTLRSRFASSPKWTSSQSYRVRDFWQGSVTARSTSTISQWY